MASVGKSTAVTGPDGAPRLGKAERDLVALGVAAAAIILFVGTGGTVLPQVVNAWVNGGAGPDTALTNALLLNIALIIFGWRRYNELSLEVKERRRAEELARQLAETDALTGLLNRRSFAPTGAGLIEQARGGQRGGAVLLLDLDNFKQVNDLNGHKTGDRLLIEAAGRMSALMPPGAALGRLGGDEFACMVNYDVRSPDKLDQLAASLIEAISQPYAIDGGSHEVTVSIGIAATID